MSTVCDSAVAEIKRADDALKARSAERAAIGKDELNALLEPVRDMKRQELIAEGTTKRSIQEEIASQYSEGDGKSTAIKNELTQNIIANSNIREAIGQMSVDDFATLRMELQSTYGGAQARLAEIAFKEKTVPALVQELAGADRYTELVKYEISKINGSGLLSNADFDKMKALKELATFDDSKITVGTSRKTYTDMSRKLGTDITNEVFERKITKNLEQIAAANVDGGVKNKILRNGISTDEKKLINDITTGIRPMDAQAFEATSKMLEKVTDGGWNTLRGTINPLEELDDGARRAIIQGSSNNLKDGWSVLKWGGNNAKYLVGLASTAFLVVPTAIYGFEVMTGTNTAEMLATFQQFKIGSASTQVLIDTLLANGKLQAIEDMLKYRDSWRERWPYTLFSWIPGYSGFLEWAIGKGIDGNNIAISENIKSMMTSLENMGLVKKDGSYIGYRETTASEKKEIYANEPDKLFQNDQDFIKANSPWTEKTGIFGKNGREYTPEQAMALYYAEQGKYSISLSNVGLTSQDLQDASAMQAVRAYGEKNDTSGKEPTVGAEVTAPTAYSTAEMAFWKSMGLDDGQIANRLARGDKLVPDGKGGFTIVVGSGALAAAPAGAAGGAAGAVTGREAQLQAQLKAGGTLNQEALSSVTKNGKVNIAQLKDAGGNIADAADLNRATTVGGFKDYAKDMKGKQEINMGDYNAMKNVDKKAAQDAIRAAYGCE
jgi:hypothetical protein